VAATLVIVEVDVVGDALAQFVHRREGVSLEVHPSILGLFLETELAGHYGHGPTGIDHQYHGLVSKS
jgi:hypothetical protein